MNFILNTSPTTHSKVLYGASISDKEIVKNSSLGDLLDQHDLIMADRGFDIQDLLAKKNVTLFIPPKRQSKSEQFSKEDCFEAMRIANLRIHVERAFRTIKDWHTFDSVVPFSKTCLHSLSLCMLNLTKITRFYKCDRNQ